MIDKLKQYHLVSYLPHGVECYCSGLYSEDGHEHIKVIIEGLNTDYVEIHEIGRTVTEEYAYCNVFPILRPLSDLTKEIEVNSEKFVPILNIGSMCGYTDLKPFEVDNVVEYGFEQGGYDDSQGFAFGWSEKLKCFGVWLDYVDSENEPLYEIGRLDVTNKLFEWHFDIFGLIPSGLAIDINTLE